MKISDFLEEMNSLAPFNMALEWDNVGLLVGSRNADIKKVYIALDVTTDVIREACVGKCDLILTHHPVIFSGIKKVTTESVPGSYITQMIAAGLNNIAMHTNFDTRLMSTLVARDLGFRINDILDVCGSSLGVEYGIGIVSNLKEEVTLKTLANTVKEKMGLPYVICYGDSKRKINRVATVPGSGKDETGIAIEKGAQVLITGDITHHVALDAVNNGLCIIDAGHYGLEHVFIDYMKEYIEENMPELTVLCKSKEFAGSIV